MSLWLRTFVPRPTARLRLVALPFAGGSAATFGSLARRVEAAEVVAVQLPGRFDRHQEAMPSTVRAVATALCDAVAAEVAGPYALLGFSFGALVAWELILAARERGLPLPVHFFACSATAPSARPPRMDVARLDDAEFVRLVGDRYGGIPAQVLANAELLAFLLPALRADMARFDAYQPTAAAPIDVPVSAWGGQDDRVVADEGLERWRDHTRAPVDVARLPGGHFFQNEPTFLATLDARLAALGARA